MSIVLVPRISFHSGWGAGVIGGDEAPIFDNLRRSKDFLTLAWPGPHCNWSSVSPTVVRLTVAPNNNVDDGKVRQDPEVRHQKCKLLITRPKSNTKYAYKMLTICLQVFLIY